ncbi:MAG: hypothetical protein KDE27_30265 [Planctomycetes bacterium]|nr:hypothetical protein [Planctomycetota bacterium]
MPKPLLRLLRLEDSTAAERRATVLLAAMFFFSLGSTFLLRPLRDQFGVDQGVDRFVYLYSLTLLATVVCVLPFWWLANRMPSLRFIPIVQHVCAAAFVLLAFGLASTDYDWSRLPWLGEVFWGGFSAINVVIPTLVWIHAVEHFRREQARRLFGLVAVGGTLGAVFGLWFSGWLSGTVKAAPWVSGVGAAVLLEGAFVCYLASLPACRTLSAEADADAGAEPAGSRVAAGGIFAGLRLLVSDGYVRAIGCYMLMIGMLATAFYVAQTELVGEQIAQARKQHTILANMDFWAQSLVLALQLFCTGRLLRRFPPTALLISLPVFSIFGLGAWWLWPTVAAIFAIQVLRRGAQYAFEKPARELLYTPLDLETKHKAKFLFDTFAFRLGDVFGAVLQAELRRHDVGLGGIVVVTIVVALVWIALGFYLGRRRHAAERPAQSSS